MFYLRGLQESEPSPGRPATKCLHREVLVSSPFSELSLTVLSPRVMTILETRGH